MKFLAGVSALSVWLSSPASASQWWYVTQDVQDGLYFVEVETLTRSGDAVTFWSQKVFKSPEDGTKYYKLRQTDYCSSMRSKIFSWTDYDTVGSVVRTGGRGQAAPVEDIVPDSVGVSILKFACGTPASRKAAGKFLVADPLRFSDDVHAAKRLPNEWHQS